MMNIVLNERTEQKLVALEADLPHALLLTGERGVGLTTVALKIAGGNLAGFIQPTDSKGNIDPETGTISVETTRALYEQTRAKTSSREVIVIDAADRMSLSAQASFLKLLEEPSENKHFILVAHNLQPLLPTVQSRAQTLLVEPINSTQTRSFLADLGITDTKTKTQLEYLAGGLPAELKRLASDTAYFNQRAETMGDTRTFLTGSLYDRLLVVHDYHQDRAKALQLVDSALMVSSRSLDANPTAALISQLDNLLHAREKIEGNCNIKLQLASFVFS